MKKINIIIAMILVLAVSVVSCANDENVLVASNDTEETTREKTDKSGVEAEISDTTEAEAEETTQETAEMAKVEAVLSETVLLDENDILIKAMALEEDKFFGQYIEIYIENNSDDNIRVSFENVSVNGFMVNNFFSAEVTAGKKANEELSFSDDALEMCGIEYISDIDLDVEIKEPDTYDLIFDPVPAKIRTSIFGEYEQPMPAGGELLLDRDGVKVTYIGSSMDGFFGPEMYFFVENNSDEGVTVQARDVSIDGFMIDPYFSCTVVPGKYAVDEMSFSKSDFEDNSIEGFDAVEFYFHVYEADGWDTLFDSEVVYIGDGSNEGALNTESTETSGEVLVDQDDIKITYMGFDDDETMGIGFKLLIENNSDKTITVQSKDESINGLMVDGILSADVAPDKKANESISIWDSDLERNEITEIGTLEFKLKVLDADNWDDILETEILTVVPDDTVAAATAPDGKTLLDESGIRIMYIDKQIDSFSDEKIRFYIENNSEEGITVNVKDISVNGYMIESYMYEDILENKGVYAVITIREDDLDENSIESINELELTFDISEYIGWNTILTSEPIVIDDFS